MSRAGARATDTAAPLGRPRVHLRRTGSTNERARELAFAGAPHGTLVTASEQTAGRGRQGRRWSAPADSALLMSLLLRAPPRLLPLAAAVAVCDVAGQRARIKWPNDIVVDAREADVQGGDPDGGRDRDDGALAKLAGILVEGRPHPHGHRQEGWAVLGIGLNVAVRLDQLPAELRPRGDPGAAGRSGAGGSSASGSEGAGLPAATMGLAFADVEPLLARLIDALERRLSEPAETTLASWRARDALRGRQIAWAGGHGRAEGIDGDGRLVLVLADGGRTTLSAGEVHLHGIA